MIQAFELYVGEEKYTDSGIGCLFLNWIETLHVDTENLRAINKLKATFKSHGVSLVPFKEVLISCSGLTEKQDPIQDLVFRLAKLQRWLKLNQGSHDSGWGNLSPWHVRWGCLLVCLDRFHPPGYSEPYKHAEVASPTWGLTDRGNGLLKGQLKCQLLHFFSLTLTLSL